MQALIIGWDEALRRRVAWILDEEGFASAAFPALDDALDAAPGLHPDVVLVNTDVPEHLKDTKVEELRQAFPRSPVIDITKRAVHPRYQSDAEAQLGKPFHAEDLIEKVRRLTDGHDGR